MRGRLCVRHHRTAGQRPRRSRRRPRPVPSCRRYGRLVLLCLDLLGYVKIDPRGAELLFQIITEREERAFGDRHEPVLQRVMQHTLRISFLEDALKAAVADRGALRGAVSKPTTGRSTPPRTTPSSAGGSRDPVLGRRGPQR